MEMGEMAMFARLFSMGLYGVEAFPVEVEVDVSRGMPCFDMVGLPDAAVKEARNRVRSALKNCGFDFPINRITVNLAPADRRKESPVYDLPLLVALLCATEQLDASLDDCVFLGELSLSGDIRPIKGALPMAIQAKELGFRRLFLPAANAQEGAVVQGLEIYPVAHISQLVEHLSGRHPLAPVHPLPPGSFSTQTLPDFSDVRGQSDAKRALEIAASGGHNVMLIGPPGSGKSMLAKRLPSILPDMTLEETIEATKLHSIAGTLESNSGLITNRPFRSPHHTVSPAGLTGGGSIPKPGEISLAHHGVLFLDELPEFSRGAMEILRQPIEDGKVTISRVHGTVSYPCSIMLVAAMNPCPCGYFGHPTKPCTCSSKTVSHYLSRVSGPLLDRLDLHVEVPAVDFDDLSSQQKTESSEEIKRRVDTAREIQNQRFRGTGIACNARITPDRLQEICHLHPSAHKLLKEAFETLGLSARAYDRVLKVSRTIADLDQEEEILPHHVAEAVQYRSLDRKYWAKEL